MNQQFQTLDEANDLILEFKFSAAEAMLSDVESGEDRRLKDRLAQQRGWCLRRRYMCNEPGPYGQATVRGTKLNSKNIVAICRSVKPCP